MASIKDAFTRDDSNTPQRLTIGAEWLEYLGTDSDVFRAAKRDVQKRALTGEVKQDDIEPLLLSVLITDWSFDEECNSENKQQLLRQSPSLAEQLDIAASKRANFTKRLLAASSTTPKSGSTERGLSTKKVIKADKKPVKD